jgi:tetratricopeptide (TPR) repeat protein
MAPKHDTRNVISGGIFFSAVIQGRDITVQLPPDITPALSGLPSGTPAFTGRDTDLRTLLAPLAPCPGGSGGDDELPADAAARAVVVTAVGGMAGIGKTELAVQAARTALAQGWFPGGALFVDLFGYDTARRLEPGQALEGFLRALGIPDEHIPPDVQDRARLYTSVLAAYAKQDRRILVVIDNTSSTAQAKPLLPTDGATGAIVTSRDALGMLGARLLDLNVLTPDDAVQLLNRALTAARPSDTRVTDHPAAAPQIAQLCGGLPLALQIVAALLAENPARPLSAMVADLADAGSRLEELRYANIAVRTAFDLSYQHLNPDHARLFRLLPINPGPDISTQAAAVLAGLEQISARHCLEGLARAHLIERGITYGRWRMHDLVRLYAERVAAAHAGDDDRSVAVERLLGYYLATTAAADAHMQALPGQPVPDRFADRDRALAWLDAERPNLLAAVTLAADTGHLDTVEGLSLALAEFLSWRHHLSDWLVTATTAVRAASHLHSLHREGVALANLGAALAEPEMRRFDEAITVCQQAAAIFAETGDRHREGVALTNLGGVLEEVRRFDEAITVCQQAAAIFAETGDRHREGGALTNLGCALRELRRFEEAITVCQQAAAIFAETGDRHREGVALGNLGNALREARRFEEAITAHQQDLAICREFGDRHGEGRALFNLGLVLREVPRFDEAITSLEQAVAIYQEIGDRQREGEALNNLGLALAEVRRFEEAITVCQQAAAIFAETGDRHREGEALTNLGAALREVPRFDEAITSLDQAIAIYRETGDRHREGEALTILGAALREVRRFDETRRCWEQAADAFSDVGAADDAETVRQWLEDPSTADVWILGGADRFGPGYPRPGSRYRRK